MDLAHQILGDRRLVVSGRSEDIVQKCLLPINRPQTRVWRKQHCGDTKYGERRYMYLSQGMESWTIYWQHTAKSCSNYKAWHAHCFCNIGRLWNGRKAYFSVISHLMPSRMRPTEMTVIWEHGNFLLISFYFSRQFGFVISPTLSDRTFGLSCIPGLFAASVVILQQKWKNVTMTMSDSMRLRFQESLGSLMRRS